MLFYDTICKVFLHFSQIAVDCPLRKADIISGIKAGMPLHHKAGDTAVYWRELREDIPKVRAIALVAEIKGVTIHGVYLPAIRGVILY